MCTDLTGVDIIVMAGNVLLIKSSQVTVFITLLAEVNQFSLYNLRPPPPPPSTGCAGAEQ